MSRNRISYSKSKKVKSSYNFFRSGSANELNCNGYVSKTSRSPLRWMPRIDRKIILEKSQITSKNSKCLKNHIDMIGDVIENKILEEFQNNKSCTFSSSEYAISRANYYRINKINDFLKSINSRDKKNVFFLDQNETKYKVISGDKEKDFESVYSIKDFFQISMSHEDLEKIKCLLEIEKNEKNLNVFSNSLYVYMDTEFNMIENNDVYNFLSYEIKNLETQPFILVNKKKKIDLISVISRHEDSLIMISEERKIDRIDNHEAKSINIIRQMINEKIDKFLEKISKIEQKDSSFSCELSSILRIIHILLEHDYIHVDHKISLFSPRDITDAMSRFSYEENEEFSKNKKLKIEPKVNSCNSLAMNFTNYTDYTYNRNHLIYCKTELNKKKELIDVLLKIEQEGYKLPDIMEDDLMIAVENFLNDKNKCCCRSKKIDISSYSINKSERNKWGTLVESKKDIKIEKSSSSLNSEKELMIDVKCSIVNCDLHKDMKKRNIGILDINNVFESKKTSSNTNTSKYVKEIKDIYEKYSCKCSSGKNIFEKIIENANKLYNASDHIRTLYLYKHEECIKQTKDHCKIALNEKIRFFKSARPQGPVSNIIIANAVNSSNYVNLSPISKDNMNSSDVNINSNTIPSIFPIFVENKNLVRRKHIGTTISYVRPSRKIDICSSHLPIIISVWYLMNWGKDLNFNMLGIMGMINPQESKKIYTQNIMEYITKAFLSRPHVIHNLKITLDVCVWTLDNWINKLELIEKGFEQEKKEDNSEKEIKRVKRRRKRK